MISKAFRFLEVSGFMPAFFYKMQRSIDWLTHLKAGAPHSGIDSFTEIISTWIVAKKNPPTKTLSGQRLLHAVFRPYLLRLRQRLSLLCAL